MDAIVAKLVQYEETGVTVDQLQEIIENTDLEQKRGIALLLQQGKEGLQLLTPEEAVTLITTLMNYSEEMSLISGDRSGFDLPSDISDLNNVSKPDHFRTQDNSHAILFGTDEPSFGENDSFERNLGSIGDSSRLSQGKSFWKSVTPNLDSQKDSPFKKNDDWLATDVPEMSPQKSFRFPTASPITKQKPSFILTPSQLSKNYSSLSPIPNPKSILKSPTNNLIDLNSPKVIQKPPSRFSTPSSTPYSFGSETTPTEERLAGLVGIPNESPSKWIKQIEKLESQLNSSENRCESLEEQTGSLENENGTLKRELRELKSKNESFAKLLQDYEQQIHTFREQSSSAETLSNSVYTRLKGILM
jgi:uncharacterized protein YdcH (DUF465 family)